jgi:hypothetical protein
MDSMSIRPILLHILTVWCQHRVDLYNRVLFFFADIIQNPSRASSSTLVVSSSGAGGGKSTIVQFMSNVLAHGGIDVDTLFGTRQLIDSHKTLIVCDAMCSLNTEAIQQFKNQVEIADHSRYIFLSNVSNVLNLDAEEANARYCILNATDIHYDDFAYFNTLYACFTRKAFGKMYRFLSLIELD